MSAPVERNKNAMSLFLSNALASHLSRPKLKYTMTKVVASLLLLSVLPSAQAADNFFASQQRQSQAPAAFALQAEAYEFIAAAQAKTLQDANTLVAMIKADSKLTAAIENWTQLSIEQQIPHLRNVFALECRSMGIAEPKLVIDNHSYPGKMVYFDFDLSHYAVKDSTAISAVGTVYLNPDKLAKQDKFASLAFLIHETRHSYQYQLSQQQQVEVSQSAVLSSGYQAAFTAQKNLKGLGFSDFLTLLNEYEAFQYGNYVLGKLTHWQVDMLNMGTFASQFDNQGLLKLDLIALSQQSANSSKTGVKQATLLEQYNLAAQQQFTLRQRAKNK